MNELSGNCCQAVVEDYFNVVFHRSLGGLTKSTECKLEVLVLFLGKFGAGDLLQFFKLISTPWFR